MPVKFYKSFQRHKMSCVPDFDIEDNDSIQSALIPLSHLVTTYISAEIYKEWDAHRTKSLGCCDTIHIINTFGMQNIIKMCSHLLCPAIIFSQSQYVLFVVVSPQVK